MAYVSAKSKGVVSSSKDAPRGSNDVRGTFSPNFQLFLNSLSLLVAERWPVVVPGLYYSDCSKARVNNSPSEGFDWSSTEPITVDHSDWLPVLSWASPTGTTLIIIEHDRDDSLMNES